MDVVSSGFRKQFKGPGLSLPPIHEDGFTNLPNDAASSPSTQSTSSSQLFHTRRPARRASIASFSSVKNEVKLQEIKAQLRRDSLKHAELIDGNNDAIARRFEALQKKTSKNTGGIPKEKKRRRQSMVAAIMPQTRRTSFRSVGSKVTSLLRVKNAFNKGLRNKQTVEIEEDDIDKASEIKDLPKEPRFASTLSVEAQYAMLKGYEDVVYGYLSQSYPEYRPLLRRNRTPLAGVRVKVPEVIEEEPSHYFDDSDSECSKDDDKTNDPESKTPSVKDITDGSPSPRAPTKRPTSPSSPDGKPVKSNASPEYSSNNKGYNRILTPPCYRSLPSSVASQRARESDTNLARYHSLPHLVPKDKQLVMTYRYHSAMDILDEIKKRTGLHATSPRANKGYTIEPVREFNLWSCVWNKEFEAVNAPTATC